MVLYDYDDYDDYDDSMIFRNIVGILVSDSIYIQSYLGFFQWSLVISIHSNRNRDLDYLSKNGANETH